MSRQREFAPTPPSDFRLLGWLGIDPAIPSCPSGGLEFRPWRLDPAQVALAPVNPPGVAYGPGGFGLGDSAGVSGEVFSDGGSFLEVFLFGF